MSMDAASLPVGQAVQHPHVARLTRRLETRVPQEAALQDDTRLAAVMAIIRVTTEPELLFIKRAEVAHDPWSGHIAFPGGRYEPADGSLQETAIRETREEVALDLQLGHVIGQLDDIAPLSRHLPPIVVRPFVAIAELRLPLRLSREVADAFWVPLSYLGTPAARTEHVMRTAKGSVSSPGYAVNGHVVWGLTERMVRLLLTLI